MQARDVKLECLGMSFPECDVPPFALAVGDWLHLSPLSRRTAIGAQIIRILTGEKRHPGVVLHDLAAFVDPDSFRPRTVWGRLWVRHFPVCPGQYMMRKASLSRAAAREICQKHGIDPDRPMETLGGTPKRLLALEIACARGAIVVFDGTTDVSGQDAIREFVTSQLHARAFVQLHPSMALPQDDWHGPGLVPVRWHKGKS